MPTYFFTLILGFSSGLRTFTAPATVCWAARLGTMTLRGTPFAFMESKIAVIIFTFLAVFEYVFDLLPKAPNRTDPGSLIARIISGGLCGACLVASGNQSWMIGAILGGIGAVIGAFAGYHARRSLVRVLKVKDAMIAIPEDLVVIGLAYLILIA